MGFFTSARQGTAKVAPENVAPPPQSKRAKKASSSSANVASARALDSTASADASAPITLMFIGCDGAGKTALAASIVGKPLTEPPKPTSGFQNFEGSHSEAAALTILDVGGNAGVRSIWDDYYTSAHGIIFAVDAAAPERFAEAAELLRGSYAHDAMRGKPLLVLATKQDLPHAVDAAELAEALHVHELEGVGSSCFIGAGSLQADFTIGANSQLDHSMRWMLRRVRGEGTALRERVEQQLAEQKEKERAAKEARKARLAAKRAAREKKEAEEEAARIKAEADAQARQASDAAEPTTTAAPTAEPPPISPPPSPPTRAPPAFPFDSF